MGRRVRLQSAVALIVLVLAVSAAGAAEPRPDVRDLVREVLDDGNYQRALPSGQSPEPMLRPEQLPSRSWGAPARLILCIGSAAAVALVVAGLVGAWWRRRHTASAAPAGEARPGAAEARGPTLAEVARLAAAGAFAEAAHGLLLLGIAALAARHGEKVPPAATSRELLRRLPQAASESEAFAALVERVETCLFGGRPLDAAGYADCLRWYERLTA